MSAIIFFRCVIFKYSKTIEVKNQLKPKTEQETQREDLTCHHNMVTRENTMKMAN
jgi:hypothetical protein